MNYLHAVFWDYPELTDPEIIRQRLRTAEDSGIFRWIMQRFLEHGRVVDTLSFFSLDAISKEFPTLQLSPYARKKWSRMLEIYAPSL